MNASFLQLDAELVPGVSAAGFIIGESLFDVSRKIGAVEWYGPEIYISEILAGSNGWIGVKRKIGFGDEFVLSYRYLNDVVSLYFEEKELLYRISVGVGYKGGFCGVSLGDNIRSLESCFGLVFNDADDEFLVEKDGGMQIGISFTTNYRASLDQAPNQVIQHVSIHDWSLR